MSELKKLITRSALVLLSVSFLIGCFADQGTPVSPLDASADASAVSQDVTPSSCPLGVSGYHASYNGLTHRVVGLGYAFVTPNEEEEVEVLSSKFIVKAHGVSAPTVIRWEVDAENPIGLGGGVNRVHQFSPEGLHFNVPSKWYVSFDDAGIGNMNPSLYRCYYYNEDTGNWEPQETTVDLQHNRFVVTINHFSRYAFGR